MKVSTTLLSLHGSQYRITVRQILDAWPSLKVLNVEDTNIHCADRLIEEMTALGIQLFCLQVVESDQSSYPPINEAITIRSSTSTTTIITTLPTMTTTREVRVDEWDKVDIITMTTRKTDRRVEKMDITPKVNYTGQKNVSSGGAVVGLIVALTIAIGLIMGVAITVGVCWWRRRRRNLMYFSSPIYNDPVLAMDSIENEENSL
jgi:hypothetical protein